VKKERLERKWEGKRASQWGRRRKELGSWKEEGKVGREEERNEDERRVRTRFGRVGEEERSEGRKTHQRTFHRSSRK